MLYEIFFSFDGKSAATPYRLQMENMNRNKPCWVGIFEANLYKTPNEPRSAKYPKIVEEKIDIIPIS